MTALSGRPRGSDDGWLNEGVSYSCATWEAVVWPSEVTWTGESGITWTIGVAVDSTTMAPGVATLRAESVEGARPDLAALRPEVGIGMAAIGHVASIAFGAPGERRYGWLHLISECNRSGRDWKHYVRRMMTPADGLAAEVIPRRNAPNYVEVAEEYLAAVDAGADPVERIMLHLACPSKATARKWIQRSAKHGWLSTAAPGRGHRRGPGPKWPTD